ncbi:MAG: YqaJ viral recombinase family protein [Flavobacteriaceae bacterium]|nr:YqaJ viral recombinase family protein [Flavobacteriaceae bacterium]
MQQNTKEWLEWRNKGLGASDAPIIMGVSPWTTRLELWEQKLGLRPPPAENYWMTRGKQLEPKALIGFNFRQEDNYKPVLAQHEKYPFLRASLDGWNGKRVVEVKCPGKKAHDIAKGKGVVPEYYMPQCQHQMMITGTDWMWYTSFREASTDCPSIDIKVYADHAYIELMLKEELEFWDCVKNKRPPKN